MTATDVLLAVCLLVGLASGQGISNSGNDFSIMFPPNLNSRAVNPNYHPIIFVTTDDTGTVSFTVSYNKRRVGAATTTHTARKGALTRVELPSRLKDSFVGFSFDSSVNVVAESGKNVIVYALNEDSASTDVFLALPKFETKTKTYNYYGVSVPKSPLEPKATFGYMALVILEDNTVITLTGTVALGGFLRGTPLTKQPGVAYTSRALSKGTTILLRSADDLTGSKLSSNAPVTVITGHQCGFLPGNFTGRCGHLTEQVPPAETWGFKFILVPLLLQTHDGYKVLASNDGTVVKLTCVNAEGTIAQRDSLNLNDQQFQQLYISTNDYCTMESNFPILVMQIASDPFMTMVPPVGQYRNDYTLLFVESFSVGTMGAPVIFEPQMSISVPNECFNPEQILFDDQPFPESVHFSEVRCDNGKVCGYEAQYKVPVAQSRGAHTLKHSDSSCSLGVIVYERKKTYGGYPGGMNLDSITVPNFCFKDDEVKGSEPSGVIKFTLQNSGVAENTCVTFATTDGTATSGVDFMVENSECCFEGGAKEVECEIKVLSDSLGEGEEDLTISLIAKDGQCVCDKSIRATISEALDNIISVENGPFIVLEDNLIQAPLLLTRQSVNRFQPRYNLCYSIDPVSNTIVNLFSSRTFSVNGRFQFVSGVYHLSQVGISLPGTGSGCSQITITTAGSLCQIGVNGRLVPSIRSTTHTVGNQILHIKTDGSMVAINITSQGPNPSTILKVTCEPSSRHLLKVLKVHFPTSLNIKSSHGILGQFFNAPASVLSPECEDFLLFSSLPLYKVILSDSGRTIPVVHFPGQQGREGCLQAIQTPGSPSVIQGSIGDYTVRHLLHRRFRHPKFTLKC